MNKNLQLLLETYYFRLPKQLKGFNKELAGSLEASFKNKELFYQDQGIKIHYYKEKNPELACPTKNLLIVYAIINKPYILDLYPGNSLIEYLNEQGYNVFLLEWAVDTSITHSISIEEQIFSHLIKGVKEVKTALEIEKINLAGYCQGGTYALIAMYYYPELFNRAVLFNTPVDFTTAGLFQGVKFITPGLVDLIPLNQLPFQFTDVPTYPGDYVLGLLELSTLKENFKWLRAVNKWENDAIPMPTKVFKDWIKYFYQENRLAKNRLKFNGKVIDLKQIRTPILSIVADLDDIAPRRMARPIKKQLPNSKELCVQGGHFSTTAGHFAINHSWPATIKWLTG